MEFNFKFVKGDVTARFDDARYYSEYDITVVYSMDINLFDSIEQASDSDKH